MEDTRILVNNIRLLFCDPTCRHMLIFKDVFLLGLSSVALWEGKLLYSLTLLCLLPFDV